MIDALDQAIYDTVHDYRAPDGRRGAEALAGRVGMNAGTLQNKAYFGHDSTLSMRESIPVQRTARDFRILHTYAALLDHSAIPRGDFSGTSDTELLDLLCGYHAQVGEVSTAVRDSLADGRVTRAEVRRVQARFIQAAKAGMEFLSRLEAIAEDDDDAL